MKNNFWSTIDRFFWVVITAFLFSHCATTSKKLIVTPTDLTPQNLRTHVAQNFQRLRSFEGKARIIIELPRSGHNGFSEVFINFPDSIFIKTEAMLGIDVGSLFLDHRVFGAYAPRENVLYYGESELLDLRDFLQIELTVPELYEAITGLTQISLNDSSEFSVDDGKYFVSSVVELGQIKYWIDPESFLVTKSQLLDKKKNVLLDKEMQRIRTRSGVMLPQIIRFTRPQAKERITVYYTEQKINRRISIGKFQLKPAKSAQRVYWGDLDRPQVDRARVK